MVKKDFSKINTNNVYDTLAEATARPVEEKQAPVTVESVPQEQVTQVLQVAEIVNAVLDREESKPSKRQKAKRINMAFTDENYQFIKTMAKVRGQSLTDFVNDIIANCQEHNSETYKKAQEFLKLI